MAHPRTLVATPANRSPAQRALRADEVHPLGGAEFHANRYVDDDDRDRRLARLVAAGDTDIRVHLERVNRRVAAGDAAGAYGALVDLFIATGPSNSGIRSRAVFWATDLLEADQVAALHEAVPTGLTASAPMPAALHSVLSRGVTGRVELVGRADQAEVHPALVRLEQPHWGRNLTAAARRGTVPATPPVDRVPGPVDPGQV